MIIEFRLYRKTFRIMAAVVGVVLVGALGTPRLHGQSNNLSIREYRELHDVMFPRASNQFSERDSEFAMDIRVRPSFKAPYQVSVVKPKGLPVRLVKFDLANRQVPLGEQIFALLDAGTAREIKAIADRLRVESRQISPSVKIMHALNGFFLPHKFPRDTRVSLDGVGYDISYVDAATRIDVSLTGGEVHEANEASMLTWARKFLRNF
jgi:hypothetical protein